MSSVRTAWHVVFAALLKERAPPDVEVRAEVPLGSEPQRADLLLLRRAGGPRGSGSVLAGLWPLFDLDALVEFKSTTRGFRRGDLVRLLGYGAQWHVAQLERLEARGSLTLVLVLAGLGAALEADLERLGWTLVPLADGYARVEGGPYPVYVVDIDAVAAAEHDDLLGAFGHHTIHTIQANHWWQEHLVMPTNPTDMSKLEGFDDMLRKFVASLPPEQIAECLTPEQRLAGLTLKQRLVGLTEAEIAATVDALPPELLVALRRRATD